MSDQTAVRISIVVACRNERDHIRVLLDSIFSQEMSEPTWEAIVADGMSDDGTAHVLAQYSERHPQLRVVANPGLIVSTGLNTAIRAARGEIIIRMDAHTRYAPNYCRTCVETLERTGADNTGGPARTQAEGLGARAVAAAYHSPFSTGGAKFHDPHYEGWVDTVPYGCWRKSTLQRIGMFDERLVRNQDDELNLRLVRSGGKIWQNPAIVSWYSPRATLSRLFWQYFQYGFWKVAVIRKHRLPGSWRHLVPVGFIGANAMLFAMMAIASLAGARGGFAKAAALWLVVSTLYFCACVAASVVAASQHGWITLFYLPFVFATFHVSYGLGFAAGLVKFSRPVDSLTGANSVFARLTR